MKKRYKALLALIPAAVPFLADLLALFDSHLWHSHRIAVLNLFVGHYRWELIAVTALTLSFWVFRPRWTWRAVQVGPALPDRILLGLALLAAAALVWQLGAFEYQKARMARLLYGPLGVLELEARAQPVAAAELIEAIRSSKRFARLHEQLIRREALASNRALLMREYANQYARLVPHAEPAEVIEAAAFGKYLEPDAAMYALAMLQSAAKTGAAGKVLVKLSQGSEIAAKAVVNNQTKPASFYDW
jgi:hypothetical protein